ncbi:MAG: carbohydrate kinase, partial [Mesorhizobium sp.]
GATLEGSATGAAALAFESVGREFAAETPEPVRAADFKGLDRYRDDWRGLIAGRHISGAAAGAAQ